MSRVAIGIRYLRLRYGGSALSAFLLLAVNRLIAFLIPRFEKTREVFKQYFMRTRCTSHAKENFSLWDRLRTFLALQPCLHRH